jgi:DNA-directed RNA polymerase specialized sigma24 family protein
MAITANKSVDYIRKENRQKRGGGQLNAAGPIPLSDLIGKEPDPKFAAEMAEQFAELMDLLDSAGDPDLKEIALKKMEGASTEEIAASLGCVRRTVERKLVLIRSLWERSAE